MQNIIKLANSHGWGITKLNDVDATGIPDGVVRYKISKDTVVHALLPAEYARFTFYVEGDKPGKDIDVSSFAEAVQKFADDFDANAYCLTLIQSAIQDNLDISIRDYVDASFLIRGQLRKLADNICYELIQRQNDKGNIRYVAYRLYQQDWIERNVKPESKLSAWRHFFQSNWENLGKRFDSPDDWLCYEYQQAARYNYPEGMPAIMPDFLEAEYLDAEYMLRLLANRCLTYKYLVDVGSDAQAVCPFCHKTVIGTIHQGKIGYNTHCSHCGSHFMLDVEEPQ